MEKYAEKRAKYGPMMCKYAQKHPNAKKRPPRAQNPGPRWPQISDSEGPNLPQTNPNLERVEGFDIKQHAQTKRNKDKKQHQTIVQPLHHHWSSPSPPLHHTWGKQMRHIWVAQSGKSCIRWKKISNRSVLGIYYLTNRLCILVKDEKICLEK